MDFSNGLYLEREQAETGSDLPTTHFHPFHELYFLHRGSRRYFLEHTIYDVSPDDLVLVPQNLLHRTTAPGQRGYDRFLIHFREEDHPDFIRFLGREVFDRLMASGCVRFPPERAHRIRGELERLLPELAAPLPTTKAAASCALYGILLAALREGTPQEPYHGESADKVQEVARWIGAHYDLPVSLRDAAEMAFMEQTWFSKRFRRLTGFGFHEYLTLTRLRAAERLLRETGLSVGEIAARCGFSGGNYFGDVFRRYQGVSPSEYRAARL